MRTATILAIAGHLNQFNIRENRVRARLSGEELRAYEALRLADKLAHAAYWFTRRHQGIPDRGLKDLHRRVERAVLIALRLAAILRLDEDQVEHFWLSQRSAHFRNPVMARKNFRRIMRYPNFGDAARRMRENALALKKGIPLAYDGTAFRRVGLRDPLKQVLSELRNIAGYVSYTPERFDSLMTELAGQYTMRRFRAGIQHGGSL